MIRGTGEPDLKASRNKAAIHSSSRVSTPRTRAPQTSRPSDAIDCALPSPKRGSRARRWPPQQPSRGKAPSRTAHERRAARCRCRKAGCASDTPTATRRRAQNERRASLHRRHQQSAPPCNCGSQLQGGAAPLQSGAQLQLRLGSLVARRCRRRNAAPHLCVGSPAAVPGFHRDEQGFEGLSGGSMAAMRRCGGRGAALNLRSPCAPAVPPHAPATHRCASRRRRRRALHPAPRASASPPSRLRPPPAARASVRHCRSGEVHPVREQQFGRPCAMLRNPRPQCLSLDTPAGIPPRTMNRSCVTRGRAPDPGSSSRPPDGLQ
jgi:hypothetical protein